MKIFNKLFLDKLSLGANNNLRQRQFENIHETHQESCQRLFNAIEPTSYIVPHRHSIDPKDELLVAVRGRMAIITFNNFGAVDSAFQFAPYDGVSASVVVAEIPANTWHTVLALEPGCVLLEVKAGPFDAAKAKELAPWAPEEGSWAVPEYMNKLIRLFG